MFEVEERGLNLIITVGGEAEFVIKPVNAKTGVVLLNNMFKEFFPQEFTAEGEEAPAPEVENIILSISDLLARSFGDYDESTNSSIVYESLQDYRQQVGEVVATSAFLWNAQGGNIAAVKKYIEEQNPQSAFLGLFQRAGYLVLGQ